ncbi:hypothetical protein RGI145_22975 (plasmid) [Roseomonas gilardii]|uniref:NmrA-like domain-containing protein n=1 Tax=Roseomonas gilardii TaxID=257708 RepID=A0A1L7AN51_9PROT|nr:NmrA family NAD(P)-binding protein [Roseomonas gilardii]APT60210.1 hypothetical protein RGI145_22975 [Roseomonas gilardii]
MTILVIGGTGKIGSFVVEELVRRNADVSVLGTKASGNAISGGARYIRGDTLDVDFVRELLASVSTVFLLNPATDDELARALLVLGLAEEAGIERFVYLSMMGADTFKNSSRAAAKLMTEHVIAERGLPTTILRPNALFQNDVLLRDAILNDHVYATPLGDIGVTLLDGRDLGEVAALELLRREEAASPLPSVTIEVVGPETFKGSDMAALWSDVLGEPIRYMGDDLGSVELSMRQAMSPSAAYAIKQVFVGILSQGVLGQPGAAADLEKLLGRPLRKYRAFATELVA